MRPRGVVLITVMFFVLIVGIVSRAILYGGPLMAQVGLKLGEEILAQRAAEMGATYAQAQLKDRNNWKGDSGVNSTTVNMPDLQVVEDRGNVIGWVRSVTGEVALFRIRFNFQDGSVPNTDNLPNPDPAHFIDSPYISVSNIPSTSDLPVPRANSVFPWKVTQPNVAYSVAPAGSAVVEIEGLAGPAVAQLTGPGPLASAPVTRRCLRVCLAAGGDESIPDAAISAGGGIIGDLTGNTTVDVKGSGTARLRTKNTIQVTKPDGTPNWLNINDCLAIYQGPVADYPIQKLNKSSVEVRSDGEATTIFYNDVDTIYFL